MMVIWVCSFASTGQSGALASVKLLPAFQNIYASVASIKSHSAAFESIHKDLANSTQAKLRKPIRKKLSISKRKTFAREYNFYLSNYR